MNRFRARITDTGHALTTRLDWLIHPLLAFTLSRLLIVAAGLIGDAYLPTEEGHWVADPNSPFLSLWAKWDSQWYVQIVRNGYAFQPLQQSNVAFFPLYPLSVRLLTPFVGDNPILAGVLLSNVYLLAALVVLYRLAEWDLADGGRSPLAPARVGARRALYYLAFFPTAFFLSALYTESLFLLLSVATVYAARRRWWVSAAGAGLLAAATRNLGVVLWGVVMWEWLDSHGWRITQIARGAAWRGLWQGLKTDWASLLIIAAIPLGLLLYMAFLEINFARPLAFFEVQAAWNRDNIGPVAVVQREITALLGNPTPTRSNLSRLLNLTTFLGLLALVPFVWRRLNGGYALYMLILLLVPATSALQSMIRYALPLFPVFILLGGWGRSATLDRLLLGSFALLLGVLTTIFVNWIFVA